METPGRQAQQLTTRPLHVCSQCGSGLVHPSAWEPAGSELWAVRIRCPDCEHFEVGVFRQEEVDAFDDALDAGYMVLVEALVALTHSNMNEETDRFVAALEVDAILPEDF